jgi:Transglutaminase-like superfamily
MLNDGRDGSARMLRLEDALQAQQAAARHIPSVITCGSMIFALKMALRAYGFGRVVEWIGRRVESISATAWLEADVVRAAEHAVAMAGALYPGRALCLEQSLVLYYVLRRRGVLVTYCHGVQPRPFEAHAWIEYRGEAINDVPEHVKRFARLPDLLP